MSRRVTVDADGLLLDGEHLALLSGEVHSWRIPRESWPAVLDAVAGLGFRAISTYVPWSVYEVAPGVCDFTTGPLDLAHFVELVAERDMKLVARIGPNCGAELEDSGWPRRVLDDPRCQAHRPDGRGYLLPTSVSQAFMPSFGSEQTLTEVGRWYDAVAEVLVPLQWPAGPIVAVHVDNEMAYHFQSHAYAMDYAPGTLAQWSRFVETRYPTTTDLQAAYGGQWTDPAEVPPPRDGRDQPERRRLDWVRFRERHLRDSLATLATMQRDRGFDVVQVHNDYPRTTTPLDQGALEKSGAVDIAAGDVYSTRFGGRFVRDFARHLTGSTRLPHLAEMGVGWITLPWLLPMAVTVQDIEHTVWRALAGGCRAANVFMLVERDRWFGSPISRHGELREPLADVFRRLTHIFADLDWPRLRRESRVLVLENRDASRRTAAAAVRGDVVPPFSQVLPLDLRLFRGADPEGGVAESWHREICAELDRLGVESDAASSSSLPDLAGYDVVILPAAETADTQVLTTLSAAASTGTTVIVGPQWPTVDADLREQQVASGEVVVLPDATGLAALLPTPTWTTEESQLDLTWLTSPHHEVLIAINAGDTELEAEVQVDGDVRLVGRWTPEELSGSGTVRMSLQPWAVQVFEVLR